MEQCKFFKLVNNEQIIAKTTVDCENFKEIKTIPIFDVVEVQTMKMVNGPMVIESMTFQPWIKFGTKNVINLPTESIVVIVDMVEDAVEQYKEFILSYSEAKNKNEILRDQMLEELEQFEHEMEDNEDQDSESYYIGKGSHTIH